MANVVLIQCRYKMANSLVPTRSSTDKIINIKNKPKTHTRTHDSCTTTAHKEHSCAPHINDNNVSVYIMQWTWATVG